MNYFPNQGRVGLAAEVYLGDLQEKVAVDKLPPGVDKLPQSAVEAK